MKVTIASVPPATRAPTATTPPTEVSATPTPKQSLIPSPTLTAALPPTLALTPIPEEALELTEEERIKAAIERIYELISEERWEELWEAYTTVWRQRCSFDAMVDVMRDIRIQGVSKPEISRFRKIEFFGDEATATYTVSGYDNTGRQTAKYDYEMPLVKEGAEWLAEVDPKIRTGG